ncbi:hypothetical protein [Catellatospora tritici]|uniref:hypothetical protein n=1 Tax=Catellatospora tritici TaxID=2851566 RepID=UPI001C2CEDB9|nr:hypothetical protein [Catellatospora tritici]MBV1853224.1 hypothetical protein [Catellatospora tritici]
MMVGDGRPPPARPPRKRDALDGVAMPTDVLLAKKASSGNRMCLDDCVSLYRVYASAAPPQAL